MRGETQLETNEENSKDEPVFLKKKTEYIFFRANKYQRISFDSKERGSGVRRRRGRWREGKKEEKEKIKLYKKINR